MAGMGEPSWPQCALARPSAASTGGMKSLLILPADGDAAGARSGSAGQEQPAGLEGYGDSHYGSGQACADYQPAGHDAVITLTIPLHPAVPGGFTLDDFAISEDGGTVTCPAGQVRSMSAKRYVSCEHGAPPPMTAGPWTSTGTSACCAPPAPRPGRRSSSRPTPGITWSTRLRKDAALYERPPGPHWHTGSAPRQGRPAAPF